MDEVDDEHLGVVLSMLVKTSSKLNEAERDVSGDCKAVNGVAERE